MKVKVAINAEMSPNAMRRLIKDCRECKRAAFLRDLLSDDLKEFDLEDIDVKVNID